MATLTLLSALASIAVSDSNKIDSVQPRWANEVVYQVFPRSYRDSNGDRIGDFRGIQQGLPTIQRLGCTSILLNPIWKSPLYHNYFSSDWDAVDQAFGTLDDFRALVRAAHRRHLKIILDMEPQYVAEGNKWLDAFHKDPNSAAAKMIAQGVSSMFGRKVPMYNGQRVEIALVDLNNPDARKAVEETFLFWTRQGVDGFRIDHMMDDLDKKHIDVNLFANLWTPIEDDVHKLNPKSFFVAEQYDWGYGADILSGTPTDAVFGFPLCGAIRSFDKAKIEEAIRKQSQIVPDGKTIFTFLENHDVQRFATGEKDPQKQRLGAALLLTLRGTPVIYMGQELGMKGDKGRWNSDGNDIPLRLAYRWGSTLDASGTADWYKDTGPWWSNQYSSDHDGTSVQEEQNDPKSLLNFYERMIRLRRSHPALMFGSQEALGKPDSPILAVRRTYGKQQVLILANLSGQSVPLSFNVEGTVLSESGTAFAASPIEPYGYRVIEER